MRCAALALLLLAAGSAGASVSTADTQRLELQVGELRVLSAQLSEAGLQGERVKLRRTDVGLEGTVGPREVRLQWDAALVRGHLGPRAVRVQVWQKPPGIDLEGRLGEQRVNLTVLPLRIHGTLGDCRYTLPFSGEEYDGWRDCGGTEVPVRVRLRLPEGLSERKDVERAALLLVLLSELTAPPPGPQP